MPTAIEAYDATHFDPPAPVARVTLRRRDDATVSVSDVMMLVDAGADATLLPRAAAERLGVPVQREQAFDLVGFEGSRVPAFSVDAELSFFGLSFRGRFLVIDDERGVLGRNVLNQLTLVFDGPRQRLSQVPRP